ncbi:hypothetical protein [Halorubrum depositum]|uniref:hypothetical protein n=1 Tax=Halorubrum depositum TaxID=2583992 RepID=UPI0011A836DD|nr:hypothetical protein [Halorubrum depositum]
MVQEITVLVTPPDYDGSEVGDERVDKVEVDPDAEYAYLDERIIPDDGETSVDRALVTDERKKLIEQAILDYEEESAKSSPDRQVQLDALEQAVAYMWDVVSGEDVGSEAERESENTTDGSTSA